MRRFLLSMVPAMTLLLLPATAAHLSSISRVRLAPGPAVLFADLTSDRIARVDLGTGVITTAGVLPSCSRGRA